MDSLETLAELAVLLTYVENQAILEPILLYLASRLLSAFFLFFFVKMHTKQVQTVL